MIQSDLISLASSLMKHEQQHLKDQHDKIQSLALAHKQTFALATLE